MSAHSGDSETDDVISISSSIERCMKRQRETSCMVDVFAMVNEFPGLDTDELLLLTNDMLDWMMEGGQGDLCAWPRKIMLIAESDMANTSMNDVEETKVKYCHVFFAVDKVRSMRSKTEPENTHKLARIMGNMNRCRQIVVSSYTALQPICHMMKQVVEGGATSGANDEDAQGNSNEGIMQVIASDKEKMTDCQTLLCYLLEICLMRSYKKCDGCIYEQRGDQSHYWDNKYDFKTFIHKECAYENDKSRWRLMTNGKENVNAIDEQLRSGIYDHFLPVLKRDRTVFSWQNGVYDSKHDLFFSFDEAGVDEAQGVFSITQLPQATVACRHFPGIAFNYYSEFKGQFDTGDWWKIPTPAFDRILDYQQFPEDVQRMIWSMGCGRMMHDMQDVENKQVICFLVGMAGTGKSIWIDALNNMYEPSDVGVIANKGQQNFNLDGMEGKFMWHISEVTGQFNLDQAKFQQIVSGENVLVDRKHKTSVCHKWNAPGMMAGNETPAYSDNAGSIARRTMAVRFEHTLDRAHLDTSLPTQMKEQVATMILKGNRAFRAMNAQHKNKSFWDFAPEYFQATQAIMKASTNSLVAFLETGGKIGLKMGEYVREREFKESFYSYCKDNGLDAPKWTTDFCQGPLAGHNIQIGKNNNGKDERLAWPKNQKRWAHDGWVNEKGKKSHSRFFHNCFLLKEYDDEEEDTW